MIAQTLLHGLLQSSGLLCASTCWRGGYRTRRALHNLERRDEPDDNRRPSVGLTSNPCLCIGDPKDRRGIREHLPYFAIVLVLAQTFQSAHQRLRPIDMDL